jgi:hypothetical protein
VGLLSAEDLALTVLRWVIAMTIALVAGTVVPFSEQQQLSVAAGGFLLAVVYLIVSLGIGWLGQTAIQGGEVPLALIAIA